MPAVSFVCKTNNKANHEEIKRRLYYSHGAIMREKIWMDDRRGFSAELQLISEGGTLYREIKELGLAESINLLTPLA